MTLSERLVSVARLWSAADGRSLARLATLVVNDGKFFADLGERRYGPTTDTLEKFGRYFAEPANWPDRQVPMEAGELAHMTGVTAAAVDPSPDNVADRIGDTKPAAACDPVAQAGAPGAGVLTPGTVQAAPGDLFPEEQAA